MRSKARVLARTGSFLPCLAGAGKWPGSLPSQLLLSCEILAMLDDGINYLFTIDRHEDDVSVILLLGVSYLLGHHTNDA
jgi:hypothetical protein